MKKLQYMRILTGALAVSALLATGVFAQETVEQTPILIAEKADQEVAATKYMLLSGKVVSVVAQEKEEGFYTVTLENENGGVICHVKGSVFVIDSTTNAYSKVADLKEGTEVMAVLESNGPMTMSLPPQTSSVAGFVVKGENFVDLSIYDENLVNGENTLQLHIDETTAITDIRGAKRKYTAEELKNSELLVFYGATTKSIPAQTTPSFVMVLDNEELRGDDVAETPAAAVALRAMAEEKGYKVTWTANDAPILLEKDDKTATVTIGSAEALVNGEKVTLSQETVLKDGVTMVAGELAELL